MSAWLRWILIAMNVLIWAAAIVVWRRGEDPTGVFAAAAMFTLLTSGIDGVARRRKGGER